MTPTASAFNGFMRTPDRKPNVLKRESKVPTAKILRATPPITSRLAAYHQSWASLCATKARSRRSSRFPDLSAPRSFDIATAVIRWIATDDGLDALALAEELSQHLPDLAIAHAASWGVATRRHGAKSSLLQTIATETGTAPLTVADRELAESVFCWLGTGEGRAFVARCEAMVPVAAPAPALACEVA